MHLLLLAMCITFYPPRSGRNIARLPEETRSIQAKHSRNISNHLSCHHKYHSIYQSHNNQISIQFFKKDSVHLQRRKSLAQHRWRTPFYRNHWNPIRHGYYPQAQIQPQSTKPKVINIPVRFVGSDDATSKQSPSPAGEEARIAAGVKIQRAVRGFLVRKNARVVRQVAAEVEQIERKVREEEARIRLDARERLVVSETLMALLLRLDSVRGVRDFRKRVIRRVISLQEAIDSIDQMVQNPEGSEESTIDRERTTDQTLDPDEEMKEGDGAISTSGATEDREVSRIEVAEKTSVDHETAADGTVLSHSVAEDREGSVEVAEESSIDHGKAADETLDLEEEMKDAEEAELEMPILAAVESPKRKSDLIGIEIGEDGSRSPESEEEEGASMMVESMAEVATEREEEGRGMREMVEKMAEENERLKRMLAQLCATSSEQCRLMEGLVDRVEHLERVVNHRMDRRKKRRSGFPCSAFSSAK